MRLNQKIEWDPEKETIQNSKMASLMLSRKMREPWDLEKS